ncbi:MAG TPA: hypothetical protein VM901_05435 [Bdellovibrionota bacterium]|jgi:hypothetical protein|nr:hypothetical protein [Bdellovibrionota bacterium]
MPQTEFNLNPVHQLRALFAFLKGVIPSFIPSIKAWQGTKWKQATYWTAFLAFSQAIVAVAFYPFSGGLGEAVLQAASTFTSTLAVYAISSTIWILIGGIVLQLITVGFDWHKWVELHFLTQLPSFLASTSIIIYSKSAFGLFVGPLLALGTGLLAIWLLYVGLTNRFQIEKSKIKGLKIALGLLALWSASTSISQLAAYRDYQTNNLGSEISDTGNWPPTLPAKIDTQLKKTYGSDNKKLRAASQYAKAQWAFIDPTIDAHKGALAIFKAMDCIEKFGIDYKNIDKIVLYNTTLVRMSFANSAKNDGRFFELQEYEGDPCE